MAGAGIVVSTRWVGAWDSAGDGATHFTHLGAGAVDSMIRSGTTAGVVIMEADIGAVTTIQLFTTDLELMAEDSMG